jgi:hypothetical protein
VSGLGKIDIVIIIVVVIAAIIDRSLDPDQNGCLPGIQLGNSVELKARCGKSLGIKTLDAFNQLSSELSFPRFPKRIVESFILLHGLLRANRISTRQVTQLGLQKVALGVVLEQIAIKAPSA